MELQQKKTAVQQRLELFDARRATEWHEEEAARTREEFIVLSARYEEALAALEAAEADDCVRLAELEGLKESLRTRDEKLRAEVQSLAAEFVASRRGSLEISDAAGRGGVGGKSSFLA